MAAQCGVNNATMVNHHPYISSNAYYGYVPVIPTKNLDESNGMDIDYQDNSNLQKQQPQQFTSHQEQTKNQLMVNVNGARKRNFSQDDFTVYMPRFKRFRDGDFPRTKECGLAQMYHEPLLRLSPAADFDMACQRTTVENTKKLPSPKSQEFEDMLLFTHGCSSYHHLRQSQVNQDDAEF